MQRRPSCELLDTDAGTPKEVSDSLLDLRWFNRWFGGIATVERMIDLVVQTTGNRSLSILEVASGEGYILKTLQGRYSTRGLTLKITLLDRVQAHFPENGALPRVSGDALSLPFRDGSFDLVSSSLFIHHLAPEQVVAFNREALRVARHGVMVHDLIRSRLHLATAYAGSPLYRSRLTRNDAPASVKQAYTLREMEQLVEQAGAARVESDTHFFYRMGLVGWKDGCQ